MNKIIAILLLIGCASLGLMCNNVYNEGPYNYEITSVNCKQENKINNIKEDTTQFVIDPIEANIITESSMQLQIDKANNIKE